MKKLRLGILIAAVAALGFMGCTMNGEGGHTHSFVKNNEGWPECGCGEKAVSLDTLGTYDSAKKTFGVYPQAIKADNVTVDKTVKNPEITGADYYLGSDGAWYAECTENAKSTEEQYKYSNGSQVAQKSANSIKYFKVEPIEWVYLAETKCLHAKKILTADVQWHASSNNYKNSNIRSWLKVTFYNSAFTENQKKKIKATTVDNSAASTGYSPNSNACEDTNDKVYLLSYKEATTTGNGFTADADRIRFPTDYALANNCYKDSDSSYGGWWWLRSPHYNYSDLARVISYHGYVNDYYFSSVDFGSGGVVPALSISE